ncbi:MAG: hypothetical protein SV062_13505, partial [Thermodesulfobacteriota bacterium]|nr:hypothetical protein [Thermodesulfobacteriota bacterium]
DGSEVTQLLGPIYINGCEDGSIEPVWDKDTPCYNPLQPILSGKTLLFGGKSSSINFIEEPSRLFLMNTSSKGEIKGPISKVVIKGSNNWQIGNNVIIGRPDINSNWKIINGNMDEIKTNLNGILSKNGKIFFVESIYNKESKNVLGLHFTDSGKIVEVNLSDLETTLGIESWGRIYSVSYDGSKIIVPYKNGTSMYLSLISFTDR